MVKLQKIIDALDEEFQVQSYGTDPSFSRFLPHCYDSIGYDWKNNFEYDFTQLFNGCMLSGSEEVQTIFLAVFPTEIVLERFISESQEGDLLFMHHPLLMECGDPRGSWGRGFLPIKEKYLSQIKVKNLSVYTCHNPLDCHTTLGTNSAIAKALNCEIQNPVNWSNKYLSLGNIETISTDSLISKLKTLFDIPYVDFEGINKEKLNKIAIVAGCGDVIDWMQEAEKNGVQAYITGEVHCHIDNEYGHRKFKKMQEYIATTSMSLIGVSHAASEYLVHKTLVKDWFEQNFHIKTILLPQEKWWL
ncbi:Nif3-like dinuclear metal center hexameric protein [Psychrobacillus sp. FSL K6-2684]|uniref:GTP cyclohydrolase 1 type 2 homolog n=1 Tax=Psychrobacillus faecigallinarum TaxID=2762235 RepID=A0ABR8RA01_9BACI|nr:MULTISPECIES: Nif3-like dinuclear metal center hexameric protein [Psychrobacillus]MBD7944608.1 Nif3-like dinuclear metal center hexameric protein [Psychrobacillus faecigallinarum]QEY19506.1 hypothetical protein D0S48_01650 [Psychrobacillus sp. AK 1817]QGM30005.1 hypothetical protein GI482_06270 [Bacillus sp. N3536]